MSWACWNGSVGIENGVVGEWGVEIRVIDYIEKLRAKLQAKAIVDLYLFNQGKIKIRLSGTIDNIPARITQQIRAGARFVPK